MRGLGASGSSRSLSDYLPPEGLLVVDPGAEAGGRLSWLRGEALRARADRRARGPSAEGFRLPRRDRRGAGRAGGAFVVALSERSRRNAPARFGVLEIPRAGWGCPSTSSVVNHRARARAAAEDGGPARPPGRTVCRGPALRPLAAQGLGCLGLAGRDGVRNWALFAGMEAAFAFATGTGRFSIVKIGADRPISTKM